MVVAAGAPHCQSQECLAGGADTVHHSFHAVLLEVDAALLVDHGVAVKSRGDQLIPGWIGEKVAGELLGHEAVEGHVPVERVDHPIAVFPHGTVTVAGVAVGVGIAGDVEPMASPTLPVVGGIQQTVDQALVGAGPGIGQKPGNFSRSRRQADQIEADAANERPPVGFGRRRNSFGFQPGQDEAVDGAAAPCRVLDRRRVDLSRRLKGPMGRPGALGVLSGLHAPGSPGLDPTSQHRHLAALQRSGRWHLQLACSAQGLNQRASVRFPGDNGRATTATQQRRLAGLQSKPAHFGLVVVTAQAMLGEQRPHVLLKKPLFLQVRLSDCDPRRRQTQHQQCNSKQHRSERLVQSHGLDVAWALLPAGDRSRSDNPWE